MPCPVASLRFRAGAMAAGVSTADQDTLLAPAAAAVSSEEAASPGGRAKRPRIDYDDSIAKARAAMVKAQKDVADARRVARNERRKKQRLVKKAAALSPDDLERIAVLKRCGLHVSSPQVPALRAEHAATGSSAASGLNAEDRPEVGAAGSDIQHQSGPPSDPPARGSDDEHVPS